MASSSATPWAAKTDTTTKSFTNTSKCSSATTKSNPPTTKKSPSWPRNSGQIASLPDSKDQVLEELLNSVGNMVKRNRLLEAIKKMVERKGESLVGGQSNKEIAFVVQKMLR